MRRAPLAWRALPSAHTCSARASADSAPSRAPLVWRAPPYLQCAGQCRLRRFLVTGPPLCPHRRQPQLLCDGGRGGLIGGLIGLSSILAQPFKHQALVCQRQYIPSLCFVSHLQLPLHPAPAPAPPLPLPLTSFLGFFSRPCSSRARALGTLPAPSSSRAADSHIGTLLMQRNSPLL